MASLEAIRGVSVVNQTQEKQQFNNTKKPEY